MNSFVIFLNAHSGCDVNEENKRRKVNAARLAQLTARSFVAALRCVLCFRRNRVEAALLLSPFKSRGVKCTDRITLAHASLPVLLMQANLMQALAAAGVWVVGVRL